MQSIELNAGGVSQREAPQFKFAAKKVDEYSNDTFTSAVDGEDNAN